MKLLLLFTILFQSPSDTTQTQLLREVVVSAQRIENNAFETAQSIKVIDTKYLQNRMPRTSPEALSSINGVFVQKTNHGGGSPFVRGLTGNQTLLLIDGIRLNNGTFRYGPNQYFNTIDPFSIQKIEILKNSGSVQYGSDAIGGTIQVLTEDPQFNSNLKVNILGRLATQGMEQSSRGSFSIGNNLIAVSASIVYRNFGDLMGGKNTGRQYPSGYNEQASNFKGKIKLSKGIVTIAHQYFEANHVPIYHKILLENFSINEFQPQQRQLSYIKFKQENQSRLFSSVSFSGSLQTSKEGRNSQKKSSLRLIREVDKVYSKGLTSTILSKLSNKWTANSGIDIYHDLVKSQKTEQILSDITPTSPSSMRGLYPDASRLFNYSIFSLHQFRQNSWHFSAGLRYNGFSIIIPEKTIGTTMLHPKAFVPNASLAYINNQSNIYFSYNAGFRSPNIDDLGTLGIVDFRYELPSKDLKPEKSNNYELGYKFRGDKIASTTAIYYSDLKDLITRVKIPNQIIDGYNVYRKENIEKAYIKGIEAEIEAICSASLKTYAGISYSFGQNITKHEPMRRIPPLNGQIGLEYRKRHFFVHPEFLFAQNQSRLAQGDKDDNRIGPNGTSAWNIINLYSGYEYKFIFMNITVQNILNRDYKTHGSGINGVGRSLWATLKFSI